MPRHKTTLGIGERIRGLRIARSMSQGDIEERSGLLRCYISRIENGHTVPSIETLERFASALDVPIVTFFKPRQEAADDAPAGGESGQSHSTANQVAGGTFVRRLRELLPRLSRKDQRVLLALARKMVEP